MQDLPRKRSVGSAGELGQKLRAKGRISVIKTTTTLHEALYPLRLIGGESQEQRVIEDLEVGRNKIGI